MDKEFWELEFLGSWTKDPTKDSYGFINVIFLFIYLPSRIIFLLLKPL